MVGVWVEDRANDKYVMRINELLESTQPDVAYHITTEENAAEIMRVGLEPRNDRNEDFYDSPRAYLITDTNDISEVRGWVEANLDSDGIDGALTILKIDISGLPLQYSSGFYFSTKTISPNRITDLGWKTLQGY
jgi:hypothetical protein